MNTIIELWLGLWWMMFAWAAPWALVGLVCVVVALAWLGLQAAYRGAIWVLARNRDLRPSDLRGSGGHGEETIIQPGGACLVPAPWDLDRLHPSPTPTVAEEATLNTARCALHDAEFAVHSKLAAGAAMAHDPAALKPTEPAMSHEAALLREIVVIPDAEMAQLQRFVRDPERCMPSERTRMEGLLDWRGTGGARNAETGPEAAWSRP